MMQVQSHVCLLSSVFGESMSIIKTNAPNTIAPPATIIISAQSVFILLLALEFFVDYREYVVCGYSCDYILRHHQHRNREAYGGFIS